MGCKPLFSRDMAVWRGDGRFGGGMLAGNAGVTGSYPQAGKGWMGRYGGHASARWWPE
jgi:hypothetical protein